MIHLYQADNIVAEYQLLTIWRIEALLPAVYAAIHDSLHWPDWWRGLELVETISDGDALGIGSIRRYVWQGRLPYKIRFDARTTRITPLKTIEGTTEGDLAGTGCWSFSQQGPITVVRYEWHVQCTRWWINVLARFARPLVLRNHALLMRWGGEGLARLLGAPPVAQEDIDLTLAHRPVGNAGARSRQGGKIDPAMVIGAGIAAGITATVAQLALWYLADQPVTGTLFRDARLTAALIMGPSVLPPPVTAQWDILLVATVIHFGLSTAYALAAAPLANRLPFWLSVLAGILYGLLIYGINLYGLTLLFPWFIAARDWISLVAHLVFGATLVVSCRYYAARR